MQAPPFQAPPFQAPLGVGQLLDRVFRLYRQRFGKLVLTAAIFFVPLALIAALLMGVAMNSYFDLLLNTADLSAVDENTLLRSGAATIGMSLFVAGVAMVLGALAFLSILAQADAAAYGREVSIGASVRTGLSRFWVFVGLSLLVSLIVFGVMMVVYFALIVVTLVFAGLFAGLSTLVEGNGIVAFGAVFLMIGLIFALIFLLLLPLGYLTTRWFVAPVVILTERCGPVRALSRSWQLTQGSFWRLFGLLVLLFILNGVVLGLPISLLQFAAVILMTAQILAVANGLFTGLGYLVSILWYPFLALTLILVYYDLRVRKENLDLDLRIQALEMAVRPPTLPGP